MLRSAVEDDDGQAEAAHAGYLGQRDATFCGLPSTPGVVLLMVMSAVFRPSVALSGSTETEIRPTLPAGTVPLIGEMISQGALSVAVQLMPMMPWLAILMLLAMGG